MPSKSGALVIIVAFNIQVFIWSLKSIYTSE